MHMIAHDPYALVDRARGIAATRECIEGTSETLKEAYDGGVSKIESRKANLEKSDLEPALKAPKDRLMTKNVAEEIVEKLYELVATSLKGKKLASFTRISSTMHVCSYPYIYASITFILIWDVHAAKEQRKTYVVVFVGVNGVRKSTNLAKVSYWLLQHKVSVIMVVCDTFQSRAIEQLQTHACRL
ncbi:hypothetical protein JHK86_025068 [Glycine max]|nr:hypothetical protein JHK86_025068 [Glycine max]